MKPRYYDLERSHHYTEGYNVEARNRGFYRLNGVVATAHGYVHVIALKSGRIPARDDPGKLPWKKWGPVTRIYFIKKGKVFSRDYPRILTRRGAIRCASRFAFEVSGR